MVNYVVGFLFDESLDKVVLVRKRQPEWQRGRLNGVGGKVEPGETHPQAMRREFLEEAGLDIPNWDHFASQIGNWGTVAFFRAVGDVTQVRTMEAEEIGVFWVEKLGCENVIANLTWLVPLARYQPDNYKPIYAIERGCNA